MRVPVHCRMQAPQRCYIDDVMAMNIIKTVKISQRAIWPDQLKNASAVPEEGGWSAVTALTLWWTSEEVGRWEGLLLRHPWIKVIRGFSFPIRLMYSSRRSNSVTPTTSLGSFGFLGLTRTASPGKGHCPLNTCTIITPYEKISTWKMCYHDCYGNFNQKAINAKRHNYQGFTATIC